MEEREIKFTLRVFKTASELTAEDAALIENAKAAIDNAYAPYSNFKVAAAILLQNGKVVTGTNQENASYPAGICAEGTALSTASSLYPNIAIKKMAITVKRSKIPVDRPLAPCGICRQRILEYETRFNSSIEIIMMGETGEVYTVKTIKDLLPLNFSKFDL
ncbi:MAG: cytidine deaminase [Bacteroidota bacterium]|nr:cytidine deaminase [Bacteroidota bacterium]